MKAIEQIKQHIENKKSFVLEAGAGSGKTYTLIETLIFLIQEKGKELENNNQKIICITYTNVAKNEIIKRLENNPLVLVSTIHEFLWSCIKSFQKQLKIELCKLNELRYNEEVQKKAELTGAKLRDFKHKYIPNLSERIQNIDSVHYDDTAFRDFEKGLLHHDDITVLSKMMFENYALLTTIITQKFPFILIDEYQDTANEVAEALIDFLLERNKQKILLGFYGDSHQKIYDSGVGDLEKYYLNEETKKIELVKKEENYRSSKEVVRLLNNFRTNIEQKEQKNISGSVKFVYCINRKIKTRINRNGKEVDDEINQVKDQNYKQLKSKLKNNGWDFSDSGLDKILLLVNTRVAKNAGFFDLYSVYSKKYGESVKEKLVDRKDSLIKIFGGYIDKKTSVERETGIEHLIQFWKSKNYNEVMRFLKSQGVLLNGEFKHNKKKEIKDILEELIQKRTLNIKDVFEYIIEKKVIKVPDNIIKLKEIINTDINNIDDEKIRGKILRDKEFYENFMMLPYIQIINFFKHIQNQTVFSTKHGTKGEEFRNVLTVLDDDNDYKKQPDRYNFNLFFSDEDELDERKQRSKNLFYVECSRAKENLVVLALSNMNDKAIKNVKKWFGEENVLPIEDFLKC
ncbi:UvrD-helicase domain-containing protein [Flavobacterium columnare]|uniref:UvrD-helicase domain-containing protein n=1 Tax=Flavobacterium columnare TaxID=996 RepID=UPI00403393AE